jgi:hypothetical protein
MAFCAYCGADKRTLNVCPSCGVGPGGPQNQPQPASPPPPPAYQQPVYQQPVYQQLIYQQPMYQPAPRTNGFAIASFICSLVCINILGIIFGHVALSQIKRTNEGGQGLAIAGLIIGYISLGIVIWAVISSVSLGGY